MTNRVIITFCVIIAAAFILTGCSSFDGRKVRQDHVESYRQRLNQTAEDVLSAQKKMTLADCIRISLKNNLDIRVAEVQQRIAKLDRKVAFSYFLPQVNLNYDYTHWDPQPQLVTGSGSQPMHDERIREITWQIQMSIFNPSTWFMYAMHARGEEIAALAADYTRQMIVLQVTTYYYYCLGLQEIEVVLDSRIRAAEALAEQLQDYQAEGLVFAWQSDQARINLQTQKLQRLRVHQILEQTKGALLIIMGLSPLGSIELDAAPPAIEPQGTLEDIFTETLLNHPQLRIADRKIAIEKEKVKIAISGFLPSLMGFANRVNTSDGFQRYSSYWMTGLSGVLTVFNGFANIYEYDAAKENVKKAALEREQATLILMLEVFRAYQSLQLAQDSIDIAENSFNASSHKYGQVYQQWKEGLVDASEMLSVLAEKDQAQMLRINTKFQRQLAIATLLNAMGKTKIDFEESINEDR
jgi:outer membrane protein TolC